ncbi:DUF5677 domain-containing protein [Filimonas effusa]|uniref:Uncharacterized protein n=1 Tax=Filimonas effusa TaxID=2508721 RepID=A0A4Q1DDW5_9BACT|nr:DUF5677 domain-containing protein [Filimonas effusa]RXK86873.1 hypothetical protein ESB13_08800 [Filimonas effusa]
MELHSNKSADLDLYNSQKEYKDKLIQLEIFLMFAIDISDAIGGIKVAPKEWHKVTASQLYTRLTISCTSIVRLLPWNRLFPTTNNFWDYFSVMSLCRNLIENYHTFFYLCIQQINDEERDFRKLIISYHDNCEKYKIYKDSNAEQAILEDFEKNLPFDRKAIEEHSFFINLPKEHKNRISKGESSMYLTNQDISNLIPFDTTNFRAIYKLLSNQIHCTPMSFARMDDARGRGQCTMTELSYMCICINICTLYLAAAILDMVQLFSERKTVIDKEKLSNVELYFSGFQTNMKDNS